MYSRGQFSRGNGGGAGGGGSGGGGGGGGGGGEGGGNYRRGRTFQFVRSRVSPSRSNSQQSQPSHQNQQHQSNQHQQQHQAHHHQQQQSSQQNQRNQRNSLQQDMEEIKDMCCHLKEELKLVKDKVHEVAVTLDQIQQQRASVPAVGAVSAVEKRRKPKLMKKRDVKDPAPVDSIGNAVGGGPGGDDKGLMKGARVDKPRRLNKRELKERNKPLPPKPNDDSTTQAADPSSEDKNDADEGERHRVLRRKKQHFGRRGQYNNRRRRMDSSERNSNDTSPQNEVNGDDYKSRQSSKRNFPELSEAELNDILQKLKRDFLAAEFGPVKKTIHDKGPVVAKEFASSILDHAMCDVTSPTKLKDIATSIFHTITDGNGLIEDGFYQALIDISKREDDIAIDAPRYMDTLGLVLGQSTVPMNTGRHKQLMKRFLNKCLQSYSAQSRPHLLASIMRGISDSAGDKAAKKIWDMANLRWENNLPEGTDLNEFLESQNVQFTTRNFSPEPPKTKKTPEELEKFADDVTDLVEKRCAPQSLEDLMKDLELDPDERVEYFATLIYAIVRGCLSTDSGDYKLNTEALAKYSSLLKGAQYLDGMQKQEQKKEHDAIALQALTALTKLWHHYNCPQNLMSTILLALHNSGTASYDSLKTWLNSEDLKNTPGIGAARLTSKRYIDDLGSVRG